MGSDNKNQQLSLGVLASRAINVNRDTVRVAAVFLTALLAGFVFLVWDYVVQNEDEHIHEVIAAQIQTLHGSFSAEINQYIKAMGRYAAGVEVIGSKNTKYLGVDSRNYIGDLRFLKRIGITDENFVVKWSYPESQQAEVHNFLEIVDPVRREAFERAREERRPVLSGIVELRSGGLGAVLPTGIFENEKFRGAVYGIFDLQRMFAHYAESAKFDLVVTESGHDVLHLPATESKPSRLEFERSYDRDFLHLKIFVRPTLSYVQSQKSTTLSMAFWIAEGFVLLVGLFLNAYLQVLYERRKYLEGEELALNRLNTALESGNIGAFSSDVTTGKIWRSRNYDQIFGYIKPLDVWTPEAFYDCIIQEDVSRMRAEQAEARKLKTSYETEFRIRRVDDRSIRWLRLTSQTSFDAADKAIVVEGTVVDITDQKSAQVELFVVHERLQRVIQSSGEGIWERNADTSEVTYLDPQCKAILGFNIDEMPTYAEVIDLLNSEDRVIVAKAVTAHSIGEAPQFNVEFRITVRNTKTTKWIRARGRIVKELSGNRKLVATFADISEEIEARHQLQEAVKGAQAASAAKAAFLASMSHEIRTPLNGIIGMTDLLAETELNEKQNKFAKIIQQSGSALLTLINDILDFSKIEAGKMELENSEFRLADVVEGQIELLVARSREKAIALASVISPAIAQDIEGDPARLGQILLNLIGNAIKFTSSGGVLVSISKTSGAAPQLRFEIRDTGIGISAEAAKKLFQPFVQADAKVSHRFGGTGLGLSISKKLVEAMNGTIGVESVAGNGSTFWFEIPLKEVTTSGKTLLALHRDLAGARALIIDQEPINLEAMHATVTAMNVITSSVSTIAEAAQALRVSQEKNEPFDLILMATPGLNPVKTDKMIDLKQAWTAELPHTVAIVDFGSQGQLSDMTFAGFDDAISKPVKRIELIDVLEVASGGQKTAHTKFDELKGLVANDGERTKLRILVADDVTVNQFLTETMLDFLGHSSVCVANGIEAIAMLEHDHFDLILMDCQMPDMDGFEATQKIREMPRWKTIPIIALTANAMGGDEQKCLEAGMNDYLSKPLRIEDLAAKLRKWAKFLRTASA